MKLVGSKQKVVTVDMNKELTSRGLIQHFPVGCWPPTQALSQLATWLKVVTLFVYCIICVLRCCKAAKKHKGEKAYVFVDLKR